LDEIIPSLCAERGTVCGSKMNFGTSMKEKDPSEIKNN